MQFITITVLTALSSVVSLTTGSALPAEARSAAPFPSNYTLGNVTWTVPTSKGVNVTLSGTVSQVKAQLKVIDPDWTPTNAKAMPLNSDVAESTWSRLCCPVGNWNWPGSAAISNYYLSGDIIGLGGYPQVAKGTCGLVDCFTGAGAWLCSDSATWTVADTVIGNYVDYVVDCPVFGDNVQCGQIFDSSGFNIIVHAC